MKMQANWFNALKTLFVLFFVLLLNAKHFAFADDELGEDRSEDAESLQIQEPYEDIAAKRAWNQLQGTWGKRDFDDLKDSMQHYQSDDYLDNSRNFDYEPQRLQNPKPISDADDYDTQVMKKRAWKAINGAWGKREDWGKMRNAGKREPGNWNNLRGLWGKRSGPPERGARSWNRLSSAWGK